MAATCAAGVNMNFANLSYAKVAVLGVVQGITELLPISSTAHMRVVPALLGWPDPGSAFSAAMQMAALLAVLFFFRRDLTEIASGSYRSIKVRRFGDPHARLLLFMVIATIPIVLAGWAASGLLNECNSPFRSLSVIAWACIVIGVLLALAEVLARHVRKLESACFKDAVLIGIAQVGALVPGVSRSGSTITAALGLGFPRDNAARFSFLIGIPAIATCGSARTLGASPCASQPSRMGRFGGWASHRIGVIVLRTMAPHEGLGTLVGVAVRGLSHSIRSRSPRPDLARMELTPPTVGWVCNSIVREAHPLRPPDLD